VKRPINHVRNLQYSIAATVLIAFVVSVANPINGWVFGLITIVIVTLPLTLITVIVQNVVTRRNPPPAESKTTPAEAHAAPQSPASDMGDTQEAARSFKVAGRVHLGIGLFVLILAVVNLLIAQTLPLWTRMFAEPFWWIIAACSVVSFVLANKNYYKAEQLAPNNEESETHHG
jgi:anaerobic C4-dicarboxylate transporter